MTQTSYVAALAHACWCRPEPCCRQHQAGSTPEGAHTWVCLASRATTVGAFLSMRALWYTHSWACDVQQEAACFNETRQSRPLTELTALDHYPGLSRLFVFHSNKKVMTFQRPPVAARHAML
jgi:hypothetical protein